MSAAAQQAQPTPTQETRSPFRVRLDEAWPADRLRALGPKQADLLPRWVAKDRLEKGEDYLTVPVLQGMLEMMEEYYPEETLEALEVLSAKSSTPSGQQMTAS